jgi:putative FmdB family regulatory protein
MPIYEYECPECKLRFERSQRMAEAPIKDCLECHGKVRRLISSGTAFISKETGEASVREGGRGCSLEREGRTCCGREERCGKPLCGEKG